MSSESGKPNVSLTALFVGVPVLVGASYYYYYYYNKDKSLPKGGSSSKDNQAENKKLSPLEQIMQLKQTGNQNFLRNNYDVAIEYYTKAIELSQTLEADKMKADDLAIFYQNRAACNEALGNYERVVDDSSHAIELKKAYIKAYLRRARAFEKMEKYDKAMVDAFSANLLEKFQNQSSIILTENIVKASGKVKSAEAMKTHKPSWPANQTIKVYFSAFTQDPIKEHLNNEFIKSPEQLQPLFDEARKPENDNDPLSLLIRGSCQSLMGDTKEAQVSFEKLLALSDTECSLKIKSNALIKKAAIIISEPTSTSVSSIEKSLEEVHETLDQAIRMDPENPDIFLHKAQALTLSEKLDEAVECLNKALELKSDFHAAKAQKFYIEFKLATTRESCSDTKLQELLGKFKSAVNEHPEAQDLLQMYAQVLTESSYFEEADQVLLNLSKLDPEDGGVHISRALLQFHLKSDPDEIAALLQEALKVDPKIIFAYEILGSIQTQGGKVDEAIKIFETALKYSQSEADYARCYNLLDSAICQKAASERLGMQM